MAHCMSCLFLYSLSIKSFVQRMHTRAGSFRSKYLDSRSEYVVILGLLLFLFSCMRRGPDGGVLSAAVVLFITLGCLPPTRLDMFLAKDTLKLLYPITVLGIWQTVCVCRANSPSCLKIVAWVATGFPYSA